MIGWVRALRLDPKLVRSVATVALSWAVLHVGLDVSDPNVVAAVALAAGAVVGYVTRNAGSLAR